MSSTTSDSFPVSATLRNLRLADSAPRRPPPIAIVPVAGS
jgi:hypothetical protein